MTESIIDAAVFLGKLGFKVFPLSIHYNGKKYIKKPATPNGFKDASSDPETIPWMFLGHTGLGMVHDDMTIVDADGPVGVDTLNRIIPLLPPAALVVQTAGGGVQYIIAGSQPGSRDTRMLPGLDFLTGNDKGFIATWPSYGYRILEGSFEKLAEEIHGLGSATEVSPEPGPDPLGS